MSATSARIRTTTTCDGRTALRTTLVTGCDVPGAPVLPPHARTSHHSSISKTQAVMSDLAAQPMKSGTMAMDDHSPGVVLRSIVIGLTAFLTVVDLFATQAILPSLASHYQVAPAAMGFAVNATTMGMAMAGLVVGFFSPHIDRRLGILISLTVEVLVDGSQVRSRQAPPSSPTKPQIPAPRQRSPTLSAWPPTSTSSRCSISPARRWCISPLRSSSRCIRWECLPRRLPR